MSSLGVALTVVALTALLFGERHDRRALVWVAKPLASLGFVLAGACAGLAGRYEQALLAGLIACAVGDVLLIARASERAFRLGIAAFALGHACYVVAFASMPLHVPTLAIAGAVLSAIAVGVLRWLSPHLPAALRGAVVGYIAIITGMVACAASVVVAGADPRIAWGATLFFLSDLSVARDAFVVRTFANRAWGLPLYYVAQIILALTAAR